MYADLRGAVGFVAGSALICAHALFLAVEHRLYGIVYAAEVGGFNLNHVSGFVVGKELDVLKGVAPFVRNKLHINSSAVKLRGKAGERFNLGFAVAVAVHGSLYADMEGLCRLFNLGDIVRHGREIEIAEGGSYGAVKVEVENGIIAFVRALGENSVPKPLHILKELFAVLAEFVVNVVYKGMGQNRRTLDNHFIGVEVAVVAGLGENRNGLFRNGAAVFVGDDFAHKAVCCFCNGVKNRLGNSVADCGMKALAVNGDGFHHFAEGTEIVRFFAHQFGLYIFVNKGNKVLCKEKRVAAARSAVLNGGAVAVGDLTVLKDYHNGDGFARLTDGGEALGYGFAGIEHSVVGGALFYGALVVKVKSGSSGGANNISYFHFAIPLFYYF